MKRAVNTILQRNNKCPRHFSLVSSLLIVLTTLFFVSSCVIPLEVTLEKREPSPYIGKHSIESIAVVDNGVDFSPFAYGDTVMVSCPLRKLAERTAMLIGESNLIGEVFLVDSSLSVADTSLLSGRLTIPQSQADEIAASLGVRNVLAVNAAFARIGLYTEDYDSGLIPVNISFTLYGKGQSAPLERFDDVRYLFYPTLKLEQSRLENDILDIASEVGASKVGSIWVKTDRVIYTSMMSELRFGYLAYRKGYYGEAIREWEKTASGSSYRRNRVAACINLAVMYELQDNLQSAMKYLDMASDIMKGKHYEKFSLQIERYRKELMERLSNFDEKT